MRILTLAVLLACLLPQQLLAGPTDWHDARDFISSRLSHQTGPQLIQQYGTLRIIDDGAKNLGQLRGQLKYAFETAQTGWYVLELQGKDIEQYPPQFAFDDAQGDGPYLEYQNVSATNACTVWLAKGSHTLTIRRSHWTGLPGITGWRMRPADPAHPLESVSIRQPVNENVFAVHEGLPFRITYSGQGSAGTQTLYAIIMDQNSKKTVHTQTVNLPTAEQGTPLQQDLTLNMDDIGPGRYSVFFRGTTMANEVVRFTDLLVVDTSPAVMSAKQSMTLLRQIDCSNIKTPPDYASNKSISPKNPASQASMPGGGKALATAAHGRYRNADTDTEPSFFAYTIRDVTVGKPYLIEFTFPDTGYRTFIVAAMDQGGSYPDTGGADTGWDYPLSNDLRTGRFLYWAKSSEFQVAVFNMYGDTKPAAVQSIRVYALDDGLGKFPLATRGGRRFVNWYEEDSSLLKTYATTAATASTADQASSAISNWIQTSASQGFTTLMPAAASYLAMYPSMYHDSEASQRTHDVFKHILLEAQRYGMDVIADFHPKAGRLQWWTTPLPAQRDNLMYSSVGKPATTNSEPAFNPLHPESRKWLLGMIHEFAQRYKDQPNLTGISLRFMGWTDPGLWDFGTTIQNSSSDPEISYGFDDMTIAAFEKDTGHQLNFSGPDRFQQRYEYIWKNLKDAWYAWKAQKVREIVTEVREELDKTAPQLTLYLYYTNMGSNGFGKNAGFNPSILSGIPKVECINGAYLYGRKDGSSILGQQARREALVNPDWLRLTMLPGHPANFLFGANYFELTSSTIPYEKLGWCPDAKSSAEISACRQSKSWISAVIQPAGRNVLERYAVPLAEGDAQMLGDGGNTMIYQQEPVTDFMRRYLALPRGHYSTVKDPAGKERVDPVAVRQLQTTGQTVIYAVNREPFPVNVSITLGQGGTGSLYDLVDRSKTYAYNTQTRILPLALQPYELVALTSPNVTAVQAVAHISDDEMEQLQQQIAWHESILAGHCAEASCRDWRYQLVATRLSQAKKDFAAGNYWAARTAFDYQDINRGLLALGLESPYLRKR